MARSYRINEFYGHYRSVIKSLPSPYITQCRLNTKPYLKCIRTPYSPSHKIEKKKQKFNHIQFRQYQPLNYFNTHSYTKYYLHQTAQQLRLRSTTPTKYSISVFFFIPRAFRLASTTRHLGKSFLHLIENDIKAVILENFYKVQSCERNFLGNIIRYFVGNANENIYWEQLTILWKSWCCPFHCRRDSKISYFISYQLKKRKICNILTK